MLKFNNKTISEKAINNFHSRIIKQKNGCHIWTGYINPAGYGRLRVNGKLIMAHRLAVILAGRKIPPGYLVCHHCDSSACCNVDHLFIGTDADNMRDMAQKGRSRRSDGIHNPMYGRFGKNHPAYGSKRSQEFKMMMSALKKGKLRPEYSGEKSSNVKLKKGQVMYIRNSKIMGVELAKKFNISTSVISSIKNYKSWKHI